MYFFIITWQSSSTKNTTKKFRVLFTPLLISSSKGLEVFLEWILDFWRKLYITDTTTTLRRVPVKANAFYVHTWAMYKYNQRIINPPYMCHKILNSFKSMKFQFIIHIEAEHYHYLKIDMTQGRRKTTKSQRGYNFGYILDSVQIYWEEKKLKAILNWKFWIEKRFGGERRCRRSPLKRFINCLTAFISLNWIEIGIVRRIWLA